MAIGITALVLAWLRGSKDASAAERPDTGRWDGEAEPFATYEPPTSCDPAPKPGVKVFRSWVLSKFGGYDAGIARDCATGGTSEHHEGRAWDWGVLPFRGQPRALVEEGLAALEANDFELLRRAGVMYVIWNRKIWRAYGTRQWEPYNGKSPHTDHVHFSFNRAGAMGTTSFARSIA